MDRIGKFGRITAVVIGAGLLQPAATPAQSPENQVAASDSSTRSLPQSTRSSEPGPEKKTRAARPGPAWRFSPALGAESGYDDNIFLLESARKNNLASPSLEDVASGRYRDMESATDLVTTVSVGFEVKGPGLARRTITLAPVLDYRWYARNAERSAAVVGLALTQDLPKDGHLRLRGRLTPSYFSKNYLADAIDGDANGSITPGERLYARGEYREGEITLDYRFRLAHSRGGTPFQAAFQLEAGYENRAYDAPFSGRDSKGPAAGARLLMTLTRSLALDAGYGFASRATTATSEVVLLDEPDFGQDLSGNGNTTDLDVRTVTPVDRSRTEHSLEAGIRWDLSRRADLDLGYEHRWRRYSSDETLDVAHTGRRDGRDQVSAELAVRLRKGIKLRAAGEAAFQRTNRAGDPGSTGEIDDYTRYRAGLGLLFSF